MDLTNMTVAIRPRRPWEAVDLGIRMARRWWWPLMRVWLVLTLPGWLLLHVLPASYLWVVPALLWWTKPVWERALLYILSRVVFGTLPTTRETLRAFPRIARPQLVASLTWRRLSPYRSMDLPVTQLEGLNGRRRSDRLALLRHQDAGPAAWLTIMGVHLESFLGLALVLVAWALIPSTVDIELSREVLDNQPLWLLLAQNLLAYLAVALVAPFYVATGFALYLNRRVRLEGWDIEIAFRRMLQKRQSPGADTGAGASAKARSSQGATMACAGWATLVAGGLLALGAVLAAPPSLANAVDADANEVREQDITPESAGHAIEQVLASEDFNQTRTVKLPKFEPSDFDFDFSLPDFGIPWLAPLLEFVFWLLVALLLGVVLFRYRDWLQEFGSSQKPPPAIQRPDTLFGLDLRPESLPADVPAAVRNLWAEHQQREALALLYRACLVKLMDANLSIRPGYTEADCLQLVCAGTSPQVQGYFTKVTREWQRVAYSHRAPAGEQVEMLCDQWHRVWQPESGGASAHG